MAKDKKVTRIKKDRTKDAKEVNLKTLVLYIERVRCLKKMQKEPFEN